MTTSHTHNNAHPETDSSPTTTPPSNNNNPPPPRNNQHLFPQSSSSSSNQLFPPSASSSSGEDHNGEISSRQLFIRNLPYSVSWQDLKDLMRESGGNVLRADVSTDTDGKSKGFGSVVFETVEEARRAADMFNGREHFGRVLQVHQDRNARSEQTTMEGRQLFVTNVGFFLRRAVFFCFSARQVITGPAETHSYHTKCDGRISSRFFERSGTWFGQMCCSNRMGDQRGLVWWCLRNGKRRRPLSVGFRFGVSGVANVSFRLTDRVKLASRKTHTDRFNNYQVHGRTIQVREDKVGHLAFLNNAQGQHGHQQPHGRSPGASPASGSLSPDLRVRSPNRMPNSPGGGVAYLAGPPPGMMYPASPMGGYSRFPGQLPVPYAIQTPQSPYDDQLDGGALSQEDEDDNASLATPTLETVNSALGQLSLTTPTALEHPPPRSLRPLDPTQPWNPYPDFNNTSGLGLQSPTEPAPPFQRRPSVGNPRLPRTRQPPPSLVPTAYMYHPSAGPFSPPPMSPLSYTSGPFHFNPLSPIYGVPAAPMDRRASGQFLPQDFAGGYYVTPGQQQQQQQAVQGQQGEEQQGGQGQQGGEETQGGEELGTLMAGSSKEGNNGRAGER